MSREGARYFQEDPINYGGLVNDTTRAVQDLGLGGEGISPHEEFFGSVTLTCYKVS